MNETSDARTGWEHIPPALAAVARRSGITAAELDAFRDDPANQDTGLPEFDDADWDRILAPAPDDLLDRAAVDTSPRMYLPATEPIAEPSAADRRVALSRLDALQVRGAHHPGATAASRSEAERRRTDAGGPGEAQRGAAFVDRRSGLSPLAPSPLAPSPPGSSLPGSPAPDTTPLAKSPPGSPAVDTAAPGPDTTPHDPSALDDSPPHQPRRDPSALDLSLPGARPAIPPSDSAWAAPDGGPVLPLGARARGPRAVSLVGAAAVLIRRGSSEACRALPGYLDIDPILLRALLRALGLIDTRPIHRPVPELGPKEARGPPTAPPRTHASTPPP